MSDQLPEALQAFFKIALANKATTPELAKKAFDDQRFALRGGIVFYISDDFIKAKQEVQKIIHKKNSVEVINEKEIFDLLYQHASSLNDEQGIKEQCKAFDKELTDIVNNELSFIAPNFSIQLVPEIESITIGKVKCIHTQNLNKHVTNIHNQIITNESMNLGISFQDGPAGQEIHLGLSPQSFIISLKASPHNAESRAKWYADVATSIIRLFFYKIENHARPYPQIGDLDPLLFEVRDRSDKHLIVSKKDTSHCGGISFPLNYLVTPAIKAWLDNSNFSQTSDKVFNCGPRTVAERMQRALGWMSRARATQNIPEKFLFFFTALEALLTHSDPAAPITETISRHIATILVRPENRLQAYKKIKILYGLRSSMVHSGLREVLVSDCNQLQYYTEAVCSIVMDNSLDQTVEDFQSDLKEAGFGLDWPIKKQPQDKEAIV